MPSEPLVKKLSRDDYVALFVLFSYFPEANIFAMGNIQALGFDHPSMECWGEYEDNVIYAYVMRYHEYWSYFSMDDQRPIHPAFQSILQSCDYKTISGTTAAMTHLRNTLPTLADRNQDLFFAKIDANSAIPDLLDNTHIEPTPRPTIEADMKKLYELELHIDEFDIKPTEERLLENMRRGDRSYVIEHDGEVVSMAFAVAKSDRYAMVVGVATHPEYRGKGYATACVKQLCRDLLNSGVELCLFYDNPDAGSIYKRLGFYDIGSWTMLKKK